MDESLSPEAGAEAALALLGGLGHTRAGAMAEWRTAREWAVRERGRLAILAKKEAEERALQDRLREQREKHARLAETAEREAREARERAEHGRDEGARMYRAFAVDRQAQRAAGEVLRERGEAAARAHLEGQGIVGRFADQALERIRGAGAG